MSDFWIGIITGVASSILIIVGKMIYTNIICYTQSKYSGKWKDEIYDSNGNIIKRDIYVLKHHKRNIEIDHEPLTPEEASALTESKTGISLEPLASAFNMA